MKNRMSSFYQKVFPRKWRMPIWNLRSYLSSLIGFETVARGREALADLLLLLGRKTATVSIAGGTRLFVDLRDEGVGRPLFFKLPYEPAETAFLKCKLLNGMVFVDIGANLGYYTVLAAKQVGPSGRVIAIEPDPQNYRLLRQNIAINRITCAQTLPIALGRQPGEAMLRRSETNYGDHRLTHTSDNRHSVTVRVDSLDNQLKALNVAHVDVLKIDVQGFEPEVFAGMTTTLETSPPTIILMEYWPLGMRLAGLDPDSHLRMLFVRGYKPSVLLPNGAQMPVTASEIQKHVPPVNPAQPDGAFVNLVLHRDCNLNFNEKR